MTKQDLKAYLTKAVAMVDELSDASAAPPAPIAIATGQKKAVALADQLKAAELLHNFPAPPDSAHSYAKVVAAVGAGCLVDACAALKMLQGELEDSPGAFREKCSELFREVLGKYDAGAGGIISNTDVELDMTGVVGGAW
jgi:hypothetical protein